MDKLMEIMDDISTNVDEAHEKIEKAFKMKETCPHYAEWLSSMATAHLSFNPKGTDVLERMLELPEYTAHAQVFQMWKAHVMKKSAKVKAMIDAFSK